MIPLAKIAALRKEYHDLNATWRVTIWGDAMEDFLSTIETLYRENAELKERADGNFKSYERIKERSAKLQAVAKCAKDIEQWWIREKIGDKLGGAPAEIFNLREVLKEDSL